MELLTGFVRSAERDGIGELRERLNFNLRLARQNKGTFQILGKCLKWSC